MIKVILAAFCSVAIASSTLAGTIGTTDFETAPPYTYAYDYAGYGSGGNIDISDQSSSGAVVAPGLGVAGSQALVVSGDFSTVTFPTPNDYTYSGFGGGTGLGGLNAAEFISLDPADYFFSFSFAAAGLNSASSAMNLELKFELPDGADADTANDVVLTLTLAGLTATSSFQDFVGNLADWTVANGTYLDLAANVDNLVNVNFNVDLGGGAGDFGFDSNNDLLLDNISLVSIPEPSVTALFLLAAAVAGIRCVRFRR
jgi:hypothetical protein